jgi:hypothetical protein
MEDVFIYTSLCCAVCTKNGTSIWNEWHPEHKPRPAPFHGKYWIWMDSNEKVQTTGYCPGEFRCSLERMGRNCLGDCMWNRIGYGFHQLFCRDCPAVTQKRIYDYWGHEPFDSLDSLADYMEWYVEKEYIEFDSTTDLTKTIKFGKNAGHRVILIPQFVGMPARFDDAGGVNVKDSLFAMSDFEINGIPYYLFISDIKGTDAQSFELTIKWQ